MKIAIVSTSRIPSTTANSIQVMKVANAYRQLGHVVQLFIPGFEQMEFEQIKEHYGIETDFQITWIKSYPKLSRYDFAYLSVRQAKRWGCELIHTWTPQAALFAAWRKIPYLMELHELPSGKFGPYLFGRIIKGKSKKRFLPITDALKKQYEGFFNYKFPADEIVIAPDGVDIERYTNLPDAVTARSQLGLPENFTAMYTGHLYAGRGMRILVGMAKALPDVQFLWVGGRPADVEYWKSEIKTQGLENIIITGFVKNVHIPMYQAAGDVLLMPYERSISGSSGGNTVDICSPMKMFEYMAAKRAIISSDLPVLHEVLSADQVVYCEPDDLDAWVSAIVDLQENQERRMKLAKKSHNEVFQYAWINRARKSLEGFINEDQ